MKEVASCWPDLLNSHFLLAQKNVGDQVALRLEAAVLGATGILSLWSMFVFVCGKNVGINLYRKLLKNCKYVVVYRLFRNDLYFSGFR